MPLLLWLRLNEPSRRADEHAVMGDQLHPKVAEAVAGTFSLGCEHVRFLPIPAAGRASLYEVR
jgi:hypothetical protein